METLCVAAEFGEGSVSTAALVHLGTGEAWLGLTGMMGWHRQSAVVRVPFLGSWYALRSVLS